MSDVYIYNFDMLALTLQVISRSLDLMMHYTRATSNLFQLSMRIHVIEPATNLRHQKVLFRLPTQSYFPNHNSADTLCSSITNL